MWLNVCVTFSHYVNMSLCHLHTVCKLCVSSAHCVQIVCVLLVKVSVCQCHFRHVCMSICCMAIACHVIMSNVIWSLSCYGHLVVGCSHDRVKKWFGVVVRSSSFLCNLFEVVFMFLVKCVVWVVFIFRLIMSTLVYEVMKVYLVKMSRCQDVKMSRCQDVKMSRCQDVPCEC